MKKIIPIIFAGILFGSGNVCAEVVDLGNLRAKINENTNIPSVQMNVEVYAPEKEYADLGTADDYKDVLVYRKVVKTDENGIIDLVFEVGGNNTESGIYTVEVSGEDYFNSTKVLLTDTEQAQNIIAQINNAINNNEASVVQGMIADYIENNPYDLYIKADEYLKPDVYSLAAKLVYNYLSVERLSLSTDNVQFIMNKAISVAALQKGYVTNIITDAELFGLDNSELSSWYKKYYVTEKTGQRIAERITGKVYNSFKEFDEGLCESFVLSVLEVPDGVDNAKELLKAFSGKIGAGATGTEKQYSSVMNKNFEDYNDLASAFNSYKEPNSNNSGNGSGGGSKGSGRGNVPSIAVSNQTVNDTGQQTSYPMTIFSDLEDVSWAEEAIVYLAENGIVNGKGNNLFYPNDYITREEFVAILVRAIIPEQQQAELSFLDVEADAWYYDSIAKAVGAGVVNGISNDTFGIGENITRQDMAVMINRIGIYVSDEFENTLTEYDLFGDDNAISEYAKSAVYKLRELEIINGIDQWNFVPTAFATRAQAAKMIYGLLSLQGGV